MELARRFFLTADDAEYADSFRVFCVFRGYLPSAGAWPEAAATREILAGDFWVDEDWIAEPDRCSQRREALGVCREVAGWLESSARRG